MADVAPEWREEVFLTLIIYQKDEMVRAAEADLIGELFLTAEGYRTDAKNQMMS